MADTSTPDKILYPDSHGSVVATLETVVITVPVSGWYQMAGLEKEIYLAAGTQLILKGTKTPKPRTGNIRINK